MEKGAALYIHIYIYIAPPLPKWLVLCLRAERNSVQFFFLLFSAAAALEHSIWRNFDKFPTSQSSQNISKMQCFSHAAKTTKKFSKLDCSRKKFSKLDSLLQHAIRRNSDKFPTSESSQNISKTQCFSHAAKTRKKFSKLDCSRKKWTELCRTFFWMCF